MQPLKYSIKTLIYNGRGWKSAAPSAVCVRHLRHALNNYAKHVRTTPTADNASLFRPTRAEPLFVLGEAWVGFEVVICRRGGRAVKEAVARQGRRG